MGLPASSDDQTVRFARAEGRLELGRAAGREAATTPAMLPLTAGYVKPALLGPRGPGLVVSNRAWSVACCRLGSVTLPCGRSAGPRRRGHAARATTAPLDPIEGRQLTNTSRQDPGHHQPTRRGHRLSNNSAQDPGHHPSSVGLCVSKKEDNGELHRHIDPCLCNANPLCKVKQAKY